MLSLVYLVALCLRPLTGISASLTLDFGGGSYPIYSSLRPLTGISASLTEITRVYWDRAQGSPSPYGD